ncbi:hypothetical protein GH714_022297 [Hevea brasiliensis]|uniref:J domain-containing protein n=1 Tax=Hevea brasiliensis TaxID=3981 RepID=A0A6A6NIJ1_HEVBR|nr:hypothetical protein GH714_022297 [Hevea brasiliensis]
MQGDEARVLLGFPPNSRPTASQVKAAYRKKVWESHPDLFPVHEKPSAESRFKLISEAYTYLLSDKGYKIITANCQIIQGMPSLRSTGYVSYIHWNLLFPRPLYVAAYFLNPTFCYHRAFIMNPEVIHGLNECIVLLEVDNGKTISASMQCFLEGLQQSCCRVMDVTLAEVLSVREALSWLKTRGSYDACVATDSL